MVPKTKHEFYDGLNVQSATAILKEILKYLYCKNSVKMQRYAFFRRKLACKILSMQKTYHAKKEENLAYMHQSNDLFIFLNSKYLILLKRKQQNG